MSKKFNTGGEMRYTTFFTMVFIISINLLFSNQRLKMSKDITSYKITPSDIQNSTDYSVAIDMSADWLIVGAPLADGESEDEGCAYIYHWNGSAWADEYKLIASDADPDDQFGCSVAISDDMALVGAKYDDTCSIDAGAVYAFYFNGVDWIEQKLTANDGTSHNHFGSCVDLDGNTAVIGTPHRNEIGNHSGVIYTFTRSVNNWSQITKLYPSDSNLYDYFGSSVSVSNDWIAVGSSGNDEAGNSSGAVYFFQKVENEWYERDKVTAEDSENNDNFGCQIDVCGDYTLITAINDDDNGPNSGSAYIFKRNGTNWLEQDKLISSDGNNADGFGISASLDGDYAVIGAAEHDDGIELDYGSAYIFKRNVNEWNEIDVILADTITSDDFFGNSVSINGTKVVVGCIGDDDNGIDSGSVFTFENDSDNFLLTSKVFSTDGFAYRYFGSTIAMDGDWLLVGVPTDNDAGEAAGAAYIFHWNGVDWEEISKICGSDTESGDQFGYSVKINGMDLLVSAPYEDSQDNNAGAVYFFDFNGIDWDEQKVMADDGEAHNHFGYSIDLNDDTIVVGAPDRNENGNASGSVYLFTKNGEYWLQTNKITPSDNSLYDYFGSSLAISDDWIGIGSSGNDEAGNSSGAVYFYQKNGEVWTEQDKVVALDTEQTDNFGYAIDLDGEYALISAIHDDDNGPNSGSAYIFKRNDTNWIEKYKFVPADGLTGDGFGNSVAIEGIYAVIGSSEHAINEELDCGKVYAYERNIEEWNILERFTVEEPKENDQFGRAVSISGNRIASGWIGNDDNGIDNGAVMIYHGLDTLVALNTPTIVSFSIDQNATLVITFEEVQNATSYKILGSSSLYGEYTDITETGTFNQDGIHIQWSIQSAEDVYFFKVIAKY